MVRQGAETLEAHRPLPIALGVQATKPTIYNPHFHVFVQQKLGFSSDTPCWNGYTSSTTHHRGGVGVAKVAARGVPAGGVSQVREWARAALGRAKGLLFDGIG